MSTKSLASRSIERRIYIIRGHRVMLDSDLAELYGVTTFNFNKAVKRNRERFPRDFMMQLSTDEWANLRFQIGISSSQAWGGRRYRPFAFTEQGVAMLSGVLNSQRAVRVNIAIMRIFVKFRQVLIAHKDLAKRLESIEKHLAGHDLELGGHAEEIRKVLEMIQQLMEPPVIPKPRIGFQPHEK